MATYTVTLSTTCIAMAGGADAITGRGKQIRVDVGGTFEAGDKFNIKLGDNNFGYLGTPAIDAVALLTHKSKLHAVGSSELHYSGLGTASGFDRDSDIGAGFINMSTHDEGSAALTGIAVYQENLAIFSRRVVQIWYIDEDEDLNQKLQTLKNTGSLAPNSIISFGESDVFFYSDSGIRSLRARDSSNAASVFDVGTKIDPLILEYAATLTADQREAATAVIEPIDGRYWLALGSRVFVFSYFPTEKIVGWSWYEPGFSIDTMVAIEDRVYVRSGNTVYLYGGDDNATYDASAVTVILPFLHLDKPADRKQLAGVDLDCDGEWNVTILVDPQDDSEYANIGTFTDISYQEGVTPVGVNVTHFAPKLVSSGDGYHRLSNLCIHFEGAEQKA